MLEHTPRWLGQAMRGLRAGADKLAIVQAQLAGDIPGITLMSPAFGNEGRMPPRFTADGDGVSPPLVWSDIPPGTTTLALLVEDADAPTPQPLVHAVVWGLPADAGRLEEGAIRADGDGAGDGRDVGRNSYFGEGWLPPDPPTGHGDHRYAFQLFALAPGVEPGSNPGRGKLIKAMEGRILAAGLLVGTYSRGENAPIGRVGAARTAAA